MLDCALRQQLFRALSYEWSSIWNLVFPAQHFLTCILQRGREIHIHLSRCVFSFYCLFLTLALSSWLGVDIWLLFSAITLAYPIVGSLYHRYFPFRDKWALSYKTMGTCVPRIPSFWIYDEQEIQGSLPGCQSYFSLISSVPDSKSHRLLLYLLCTGLACRSSVPNTPMYDIQG